MPVSPHSAVYAQAVDPARYASEQEAWKRWHSPQSQDEAEFDQT